MAYIVMAYIVIAYIVMAYIVMAYIVMAHIVMARAIPDARAGTRSARRSTRSSTCEPGQHFSFEQGGRHNAATQRSPTLAAKSQPSRLRETGMSKTKKRFWVRLYYLFPTTFRGMPTANAEGPARIGGRRRKGLGETRLWGTFRSTTGPRRSPSACSEILKVCLLWHLWARGIYRRAVFIGARYL